MKTFVFLSSVCLLLLVSCNHSTAEKDDNVKSSTHQGNVIRYAKNLKIYDNGSIVKIEILNKKNDSIIFRTDFHRKKKNETRNSITLPIKNLAVLSATQIGMLTKLNAYKSINIVPDKKYIYDQHLVRLINEKKMKSYHSETGISLEEIVASQSKYVLYDDFGNGYPGEEKLKKLNIACIPIADWQEQHPLGKAEWILLYGYLIGKENEAFTLFQSIEKEYKQLKKIAAKQKNKPSLISGNLISEIWYAPAAQSYNAALFADAGGNYIYSKTSSMQPSIEKSIEEVITENKETEFWFNPGFPSKAAILKHASKTQFLPMLQNNKVYCYSPNMNLFWEKSAIEPHKVLEDLIRILHPNALPEGKLHFYHKLN
ncbi:MAG: ABC transporter substrate-binding protein [Bacteroidota bacterium]